MRPQGQALERLLAARRLRERAVEAVLWACAASALAVTLGIVWVLVSNAWGFFGEVGPVEFLTGTRWAPFFMQPGYGVLPLLTATATVTAIALCVAVPLGTATAIYLAEFAPGRVRDTAKPVLELLSGLPTVLFGYFALLVVTPALQAVWPGIATFNLLAPGLVIGVMVSPMIVSLAEEALSAVPDGLREAAMAMGASRRTTVLRVLLPAALPGVSAAWVLAASRVAGETMVVAIAGGQTPRMGFDPTEAAATITAYIARVALGDLPPDSTGYQGLFAAGLLLFVLTLGLNIAGLVFRRRLLRRWS